jgi:hypothetical protein
MMKPVTARTTRMAPTAMPTLAPRDNPLDLIEDDDMVAAVGVVMFTAVVEKREPWRLRMPPALGFCWQPAMRAVKSLIMYQHIEYYTTRIWRDIQLER